MFSCHISPRIRPMPSTYLHSRELVQLYRSNRMIIKGSAMLQNGRHFANIVEQISVVEDIVLSNMLLRMLFGVYSISQEICTRFLLCCAVLCCGYILTDFHKSIRLTSLALWQSDDWPSASTATLMNIDKYFIWIHYERLHNHNKAKHNKTVCIFLGIYCRFTHISGDNIFTAFSWFALVWHRFDKTQHIGAPGWFKGDFVGRQCSNKAMAIAQICLILICKSNQNVDSKCWIKQKYLFSLQAFDVWDNQRLCIKCIRWGIHIIAITLPKMI